MAPRIESPRGRGWSSWGDDVAEVAREYLGVELKPWQHYAAERITEHRNGELRWPYALLTVGRQQGKTVLLASLIAWRILRGPHLFGEPQNILSMAQGIKIAHLVFDQVMRDRLEHHADKTIWQLGNESARFGDGHWRIVSNHVKSVTGFSSSLVVADEAWNIDRDVIVSGVMPQTIQRAQPQLVMCSTAGDSRSDLVAHYRDMAQQHRSEVLILEWSAPPDCDPDDEDAWRWSLPDWKPKQYRRLRQVTDETAWRMQYLNQWVINRDGWISLAQWLPLRDTGPMPPGGVVVVGPARDYSAWAGVHAAVDEQGVTHVRQMRHTVPDTVWRWAHNLGDDVALHVNVGTRFRDPDWLRPVAGTVGARELHQAIRLVQQRIRDGGVRHDGSELLTEHVLRASVTDLPGGTTVMRSPTGEPIDLCELLCVSVELAGRTMRGPVLV